MQTFLFSPTPEDTSYPEDTGRGIAQILAENPLKGEYFLPFVVDELLQEKKAEVTVLRSYDNWYGVTYKEDKENVMAALQKLKDEGRYPQKLWEE